MTQESRIRGLIIEEEPSQEAAELDELVELVLLTVRIKGQPHPYTLDLTNQPKIRNLILSYFLTEEEELGGSD